MTSACNLARLLAQSPAATAAVAAGPGPGDGVRRAREVLAAAREFCPRDARLADAAAELPPA